MHDNQHDLRKEHHPDPLLETAFGDELPPDIESAMERQYRWAEAALARRESRVANRPFRGAIAAVGLFVATATVWIAFDALWQPKATWAEVMDSFDGVTSVAVTTFKSDHSRAPVERIDYWIGSGGQVRLHLPQLVVFAAPGKAVTAFDPDSGRRFNPSDLTAEERGELSLPATLVDGHFLSEDGGNSLAWLLAQFTNPGAAPAPSLNTVPSVSRDLLVFDTGDAHAGSWMRVWALRESHLPVRARIWDSDDGGSTEALFDYSSVQPSVAFEPDAYEEALTASSGTVNRRFALLQDPGGQFITPSDMHAERGFHMPEVVDAGQTAEGLVWVESRNARNQTPEGRSFYGFGKLQDNLGQQYLHRWMSHRAKDNVVLEYFIPLNLGLDYQRPASMALSAWNQPDNDRQPTYEIGSIPLTVSEKYRPFPAAFENAPTPQDALRTVIGEWARREHWDNFDRLLDAIPGEPEDNRMALFREAQRLDKLAKMGQDDGAFALSTRLVPLVVAGSDGFPWEYETVIRNHVLQLARRGEFQSAAELLAPYRAELRTEDASTRPFHFVTYLAQTLERTLSDANAVQEIFGFNPRAIPAMVEQMTMMASTGVAADEAPRFQPWRDYVAMVARRYDEASLPQTYEIASDALPYPPDTPAYAVALPNSPGYTIAPLGPDWLSIARTLAYATNRDPEHIQVAEQLREKKINWVVVYRDAMPLEDVLKQIAAREGVVIRDTAVRKPVWVARYDGRPLPYWRDVRPADLGDAATIRGGGTQSTAAAVLKQFEASLQGLGGDPVIVLDETGLPVKPGENQTWGTICLTYRYAFGTTPEAIATAKDWFRDNFGITFTAEEREVPMIEVLPAP